ncbi:serine/threonine-protein kinase [Nocardioides sp.]|uniref:serine/threonine-protein kinase n=1 Tax=Nocardioides sp. TaxID=35761 RepID=UPI002615AFC6|nr:serine/threonine-protein kinase [Nocardioides sp.]
MAVPAPPNLPGFTFIEPIGEGGFADVYLYEQRLPTRRVAVKVLKKGADGARLEMFYAEANVMAQLSSHPSIMPIYQADVSAEGHPYLVMEHCPGPHLAQRFRRERLDVAEVLEIAVKVSSAVETAHRAGILHRDIKPHNILTNVYGAPLLTDFGISSAVGEGAEAEQGMSVPWSAPEVLSDSPHADVRSDVFSLAGTVYSLLAGRSPFEVPGAPNDNATLISRIERHRPSRILRTDVPDSLNEVLLAAMSRRPEDRPASAMAFAHLLQEIEIELRRTPTRLEVLDAGPREGAAAGANDERTMIKPVSVIVPEQFHPTALPREIEAATIMQRRFQAAPAGLVAPGPSLQMAPEASRSGHRVGTATSGGAEEGRRSPWVIAVVSVVVVAIAAYGVIAMLRGGSGPGENAPDPFQIKPADAAGGPAPAPAVKATRIGGGYRFSWVNQAPADGDLYKVVRTRNGESLPELRIPATSIDFRLRSGQTGCVTVTVIRKNLTQRAEASEPFCMAVR